MNTYGGSLGGPIVIPGLFDGRGKAFFFFNEEISDTPNQTPRGRLILRDEALTGNFRYGTTNPQTVNLLALAAANGHLSTPDPIILALLRSISDVSKTTGSTSRPAAPS